MYSGVKGGYYIQTHIVCLHTYLYRNFSKLHINKVHIVFLPCAKRININLFAALQVLPVKRLSFVFNLTSGLMLLLLSLSKEAMTPASYKTIFHSASNLVCKGHLYLLFFYFPSCELA